MCSRAERASVVNGTVVIEGYTLDVGKARSCKTAFGAAASSVVEALEKSTPQDRDAVSRSRRVLRAVGQDRR